MSMAQKRNNIFVVLALNLLICAFIFNFRCEASRIRSQCTAKSLGEIAAGQKRKLPIKAKASRSKDDANARIINLTKPQIILLTLIENLCIINNITQASAL
jgi:hypothetical protein